MRVIMILGYSLMVTAMNLPFGFEDDYNESSESNPDEEGDANSTVSTTTTLAEKIEANNEVITPFIMWERKKMCLFAISLRQRSSQWEFNCRFEIFFFSLFGLHKPEDLKMSSLLQPWTIFVFKLIFATYLLLTVVVLINLLIAMMSDTYQRIQQQVISLISDFGRQTTPWC